MPEEAVFLSVIVPVYNAAKFIRPCLDSVLATPISASLELILVDDGSTDGSAAICDAYAARDPRVRTLYKENGGASTARNMGIRAARGEYLLFVDSDDTVRPGALAEMIRLTGEEGFCDVVFLTADRMDRNGKLKPFSYRYEKKRVYRQSAGAVLDYLTRLSHYPVSPCVKLLNRGFVLQNQLFFREGMVCEDVDHTYRVLLSAQTFNVFDLPYYIAHVREGSVMTSPANAIKRFEATLWIATHWEETAKTSQHKDVILAFLAAQYIYLCAMYADLPRAERRRRGREVKGLSWLIAHGIGVRFAAIGLSQRLMGLGLMSWLYKRILL